MDEKIYSKALAEGKKKTLILLIVGLVIALLSGTFVIYTYITTEANAPVITSYEELMQYKDEKGKIVKLVTDEYYYIGYTYQYNGKNTAWYYFILLDDNSFYVTVRNKQNLTNTPRGEVKTFVGIIHADPYRYENLQTYALLSGIITEEQKNDRTAMNAAVDVARNELLDIEITDKFDRDYMYVLILTVGGLICAAIALFGGSVKNNNNKKALAKFMDVDMADERFTQEYASDDKLDLGKTTLTRNWLYSSKFGDIFLMPASEVVWAYKLITQHRYNGIPTGKTYSALINMSNGKTLTIQNSEASVDLLLEYIVEKWPNTIVGFDDERKMEWTKNNKDFIDKWRTSGKTE